MYNASTNSCSIHSPSCGFSAGACLIINIATVNDIEESTAEEVTQPVAKEVMQSTAKPNKIQREKLNTTAKQYQ